VVVFDAERAGSGRSLWVARLDGDRTPRGLHQTPFEEKDPTISSDGRWLAYQSNETGAAEIYVQAFPSPGRKWTISIDGGIQPVWSRDSHELFYRHGDAIMGVKIETSGSFSATRPQLVFQTGKDLTISTAIGSTFFPYDVAPDGKFLVVERMPSSMPARPITVVLNWLHERM
jgi:serine/threonine-protein kinase